MNREETLTQAKTHIDELQERLTDTDRLQSVVQIAVISEEGAHMPALELVVSGRQPPSHILITLFQLLIEGIKKREGDEIPIPQDTLN